MFNLILLHIIMMVSMHQAPMPSIKEISEYIYCILCFNPCEKMGIGKAKRYAIRNQLQRYDIKIQYLSKKIRKTDAHTRQYPEGIISLMHKNAMKHQQKKLSRALVKRKKLLTVQQRRDITEAHVLHCIISCFIAHYILPSISHDMTKFKSNRSLWEDLTITIYPLISMISISDTMVYGYTSCLVNYCTLLSIWCACAILYNF